MANLARYNPLNDAVSLREAMDRLFEDSFIAPRLASLMGGRGAASNLYETADGFTLQVSMPGVKPEDIEITLQQDTVNLKWETKVQIPESATSHWSGFQSGQYQQSFTLPSPINAEQAAAEYADGVLTLTLPKAEHAKSRTIKVKVS